MKNYRDLEIYKEAKTLAIQVHQMTLSLPKFEMYEEGSQLKRSSKAIAALIVEGYGRRRYEAEFIKYLVYAIAECDETLLHIELLYETGSLGNKDIHDSLKNQYINLSKKLNKFTQWVEVHWNHFPAANI